MTSAGWTAIATLPALLVSGGVVLWVRRGNANDLQTAVICLLIVVDLALTLAGVSLRWSPVFEVAAPVALALSLAAIFVGAERGRDRSDDWATFEREFHEWCAGGQSAPKRPRRGQ